MDIYSLACEKRITDMICVSEYTIRLMVPFDYVLINTTLKCHQVVKSYTINKKTINPTVKT